jgi:hypothetical protein
MFQINDNVYGIKIDHIDNMILDLKIVLLGTVEEIREDGLKIKTKIIDAPPLLDSPFECESKNCAIRFFTSPEECLVFASKFITAGKTLQ